MEINSQAACLPDTFLHIAERAVSAKTLCLGCNNPVPCLPTQAAAFVIAGCCV